MLQRDDLRVVYPVPGDGVNSDIRPGDGVKVDGISEGDGVNKGGGRPKTRGGTTLIREIGWVRPKRGRP